MTGKVDLDVLVVGGGIAGLWILDRLLAAGFDAALIERQALGAGQTMAAQGIIHGGTKYAVESGGGKAAAAVAGMPAHWRSLLKGAASPAFDPEALLADRHLLVTGGIGMEIAARLVTANSRRLATKDWPALLASAPGSRRVIALDEPVVDVRSIVSSFAVRHASRIRRVEAVALEQNENGASVTLRGPRGRPGRLRASLVIAAAGAGTAMLLPGARQQSRPLHMVMARNAPAALFAHWISGRGRPRLTLTSHARDNGHVWYCGGDLAERGIAQAPDDLVIRAKEELERALGPAAVSGLRYATYRIDRIEGAVRGGKRPDGPVLQPLGRALAVWPTKLALAPAAAADVLGWVRRQIAPREGAGLALGDWPKADVASPPWAEVERWS